VTEQVCPSCLRPTAASSKGSLTQWVATCTCGLKPATVQHELSVQYCRTCGKRVGQGRHGSFTQYIFRHDTCRCEKPQIAEKTETVPIQFTTQELPIDWIENQPAIDVGADAFPLERYKPFLLLGEGASGKVYLAADRLLNKKVAVKIVRNLTASQLIAFQQEARATSSLKHPGIVSLLDFGLIDSAVPYMVLEFVSGQSLQTALKLNGPLPWRQCIQVFKHLCDTLAYAHEQGIFHRDVQPGNILLSREQDGPEGVRLIDFGIASLAADTLTDANGPTLVGTPLYMSPDQGLGRKYDARSEIYSLGCVLFECLTGSPPFRGETALETLSLHANAMPPSVTETFMLSEPDFDPGFPTVLEDIVHQCLAKKPEDRFQSVAELRDALDQIEDFEEDDETSPASAIPDNEENVSKTNLVPLAAIACVIVGMFGIVLFAVLEHRSPEETKKLTVEDPFLFVDVTKHPEPKGASDAHSPQVDPAGLIADSVESMSKKKSQWHYDEHSRASATTLLKFEDPSAMSLNINAYMPAEYFADLGKYKNLRKLNIANNRVTDATTASINSSHLQILRLDKTEVRTLEHVAKIKTLEDVSLRMSRVNDAAIARLTKLPRLISLDIRGTDVTDKVCASLLAMPTLTFLYVDCISEPAIQKLRKAAPCLSIYYDKDWFPSMQYEEDRGKHPFKDRKKAIEHYKRTVAICEEAYGPHSPHVARALTWLASQLAHEKDHSQSKRLLNRAIKISRDTDTQRNLIGALNVGAYIAASEKNTKEQIRYLEEEFKLLEQRETNRVLIVASIKLAHLYFNEKNFESARKAYLRTIDHASEIKKLAPRDTTDYVAKSWSYAGRCASRLKEYRAAVDYQQKAVADLLKNPVPKYRYQGALLASCYAAQAQSHWALKEYGKAIMVQKQAVATSRQWGLNNPAFDKQLRNYELHKAASTDD